MRRLQETPLGNGADRVLDRVKVTVWIVPTRYFGGFDCGDQVFQATIDESEEMADKNVF